MKKKTFMLIGIAVVLVLMNIYLLGKGVKKVQKKPEKPIVQLAERENAMSPKTFKTEAAIGAIGDILLHDTVYLDARDKNGFNFSPMFSKIIPVLQKPDFLIANMESIPGGVTLGLSSYPRFNSPKEIVDALQDAGVDMVTTANNHSLDKGEAGIKSAVRYYEKKGFPYTGTFKSPEDKKRIRVVSVNGIKIAVLAYAEHFNGLAAPRGKGYLVSPLDAKKVLSDIKEAKSQADVVVLSLHWGDEYVRSPNKKQKRLAKTFIHHGADIIFGHHPHVLQPAEWIKRNEGEKGLVVYSLGNFLSGQIWDYKDVGGMAEVLVQKESGAGKTKVTLKEARFHPTFTASSAGKGYKIYPLEQAHEMGLTTVTEKNIHLFMKLQ